MMKSRDAVKTYDIHKRNVVVYGCCDRLCATKEAFSPTLSMCGGGVSFCHNTQPDICLYL